MIRRPRSATAVLLLVRFASAQDFRPGVVVYAVHYPWKTALPVNERLKNH